ncbi:peptidoglycan-associated lipoprotein [Idiomarina sp. X4]|jgi:peptidoglycan-associated lipoprotein|uniref:Peptidoglycan-associated lipoprotein n=1 Tax=Idiomarina piscisalsi TaxID=1096243 RepID=A0ABM6LUJ0_9GAMM|nr:MULTISPECIES: peptidoglycan-associated lipoprotein Pal [Idiomarina]ASG66229.1 peptidoglycan-associated lipoprotein [Idiomarina piscisalsi]ATZ72479.1 peptidoglycan-associated lipoprotein [Idiomarina sp. X4]MTJ01073.1 peptidoglycan-associated lipoprotein Pal [Idiomarina piscisalsi]RXS43995.1 peptidoglycan-associated lipoprotein Pal [Idiomarina sp. 29L]
MQLNKLFKALAIVVPMATLAACSSNQETDSGMGSGQETNQQAEQDSGVEVGAAERQKTLEEQRQEKMEALRKEHIVYFAFDKSNVQSEYAELLAAHADYLVKNPSVKVVIEGHADERGTPEYNIALGERRAQAVESYLHNLGVQDSQTSTVSYGEEKPLVDASTESAYAKNRRAVLVY